MAGSRGAGDWVVGEVAELARGSDGMGGYTLASVAGVAGAECSQALEARRPLSLSGSNSGGAKSSSEGRELVAEDLQLVGSVAHQRGETPSPREDGMAIADSPRSVAFLWE